MVEQGKPFSLSVEPLREQLHFLLQVHPSRRSLLFQVFRKLWQPLKLHLHQNLPLPPPPPVIIPEWHPAQKMLQLPRYYELQKQKSSFHHFQGLKQDKLPYATKNRSIQRMYDKKVSQREKFVPYKYCRKIKVSQLNRITQQSIVLTTILIPYK